MTEYFKGVLETIKTSVESIDKEVFNQLISDCYNALKNGNKIIVSGLGKNVPICDKFVGTMLSLGLNANFLHTNSAIHGDIGMVKENDIVIILSKSGETVESIFLTEKLACKNAKLWLFSYRKNSTLSNKIENSLILDLEHEGDKWNIVPNNSTTVNLLVLQGLAMTLADKMNVSLGDFKENHPGGYIGEVLKGE